MEGRWSWICWCSACSAWDAACARPGEFSERAFLNGKIDIAQAEAVADLIDAGTAAAARPRCARCVENSRRASSELQSQLTELRAYVEAAIDFPDEEIDFLSTPAVASRLTRIFRGFDSISARPGKGRSCARD